MIHYTLPQGVIFRPFLRIRPVSVTVSDRVDIVIAPLPALFPFPPAELQRGLPLLPRGDSQPLSLCGPRAGGSLLAAGRRRAHSAPRADGRAQHARATSPRAAGPSAGHPAPRLVPRRFAYPIPYCHRVNSWMRHICTIAKKFPSGGDLVLTTAMVSSKLQI